MKVLVIGGMGIIGSAITEAAAKKKMEVYVLSRRSLISRLEYKGTREIGKTTSLLSKYCKTIMILLWIHWFSILMN